LLGAVYSEPPTPRLGVGDNCPDVS